MREMIKPDLYLGEWIVCKPKDFGKTAFAEYPDDEKFKATIKLTSQAKHMAEWYEQKWEELEKLKEQFHDSVPDCLVLVHKKLMQDQSEIEAILIDCGYSFTSTETK